MDKSHLEAAYQEAILRHCLPAGTASARLNIICHETKNSGRLSTETSGAISIFRLMPDYIIPPAGTAGAGVGSGISTIPHSVVRNMPATDAAFSRATRATFVG